ncbi:MAG TPA: MerR family transcriptional regulator [Candidatus Babeliales bacterium]|nr:MerR family transcriptional regulator [Candidatus Babeliales bacterium]
MKKRTFRIGELAKQLNIERFVIRFWEKEFDLAPDRTEGKQRTYTHDDLMLFTTIKDLLHNKGYTIAGARQALKAKDKSIITSEVLPSTKLVEKNEITPSDNDLQQKLISLREQLQRLYTVL